MLQFSVCGLLGNFTKPTHVMKPKLSGLGLAFALTVSPLALAAAEATFLVQFNDYVGEPGYFSLYLVDPDGRYVRTLWVSGDDAEWYPDMPRWWKYVGRAPQEFDVITGASTKAGDRAVVRIDLEDDVLDAGYQVRVETAVEDQENHPADAEATLETAQHGDRIPGTGYVRYLRYQW